MECFKFVLIIQSQSIVYIDFTQVTYGDCYCCWYIYYLKLKGLTQLFNSRSTLYRKQCCRFHSAIKEAHKLVLLLPPCQIGKAVKENSVPMSKILIKDTQRLTLLFYFNRSTVGTKTCRCFRRCFLVFSLFLKNRIKPLFSSINLQLLVLIYRFDLTLYVKTTFTGTAKTVL